MLKVGRGVQTRDMGDIFLLPSLFLTWTDPVNAQFLHHSEGKVRQNSIDVVPLQVYRGQSVSKRDSIYLGCSWSFQWHVSWFK